MTTIDMAGATTEQLIAELTRRAAATETENGEASGERAVTWGVRVDEPHPRRKEKVGDVITVDEGVARHGPRIWRGWTIVRREWWIGPWVEVTDP